MSRWSDQFSKHQIHTTIKNAFEALDFDPEGLDSEVEAEWRRLRKIFNLIKNILDETDPEFYPENLLNNLSNHLQQQVVAQISNYGANGNVGHLRNANDQLTSQIPTIYQIAGLTQPQKTRETITDLESAYDEFCNALEKTKTEFETVIDGNNSEIADLEVRSAALSSSITELQSTTDGQMSLWQTEFTDAQSTRAQEHSDAQSNRAQEHSEEQATRAKEHSDAQIQRGKEYDEALREFKTTAENDRTETTASHNKAFKDTFDQYAANVSTKTKDINDKHASILEIHGLVTNDGVAGGYKRGADDEKRAAFWWSVVSMVCYLLILVWVVSKGKLGFGISNGSGIDWPVVATTISVTAVAFVAAQFAGKQSRIHRMNEQRMRWFSFEIAAIDPFLSSLEPEDQQELKKQLSERLFGQDRVVEDKPTKVKGIDAETFKSLSEPIIEAVKSVRS
ncbi:hypothetical protein [Ruegeria atlantica]|uniref:hypothetical protein n=1 Tax=Ruegeria atlantica TaxID=81569 RepID=UPI00147D7C01|nr:hypothetical protein [Ruegeria atlantica]